MADILHRRCATEIVPSEWARTEWSMACPDAYMSDLYSVLEDTLADSGLIGRYVPDLTPKGDAYEFMFFYRNRQFYAKLNLLLPQRQVLCVVSAHLPHRGNQL